MNRYRIGEGMPVDMGAQARGECTCAQVYLGQAKVCLIDRFI